jgi:hypothetical protein
MFEMYRNETLNIGVIAEVQRRIVQMFYTVDREMGDQKPEQQPPISQQVSGSLPSIARLLCDGTNLRKGGEMKEKQNNGVGKPVTSQANAETSCQQ